MKTNYSNYQFSRREWAIYLGESILLNAGINYILFRSILISVFLLPISIIFVRSQKQKVIKLRKERLHYQFKDGLSSLSVALRAGYSLENSIAEAVADLQKIYGEKEDIVKEFQYIANQLRIRVPLEKLLDDFAQRSAIEDIANFAAVIRVAKQMGGDMASILQKSAKIIEEKIDVKQEIAGTVAAKKMEQLIMSLMPIGIILYMRITSPGFLEVLYGNVFGAVLMSGCLMVYLFSYWLGQKIVDIEV